MLPRNLKTIAIALVAILFVCFAAAHYDLSTLFTLTSFAGIGGALALKDKLLKVTKALPNGAASTTSDGFDLRLSTRGDFVAQVELLITAPALTVGELANGDTMTYIVEHDTDSAFGTVATLIDKVIVQTGAGGAGAVAATAQVRLPIDVKGYVRVKCTNSAAGNPSAKSFTAELVF